MRILKFICVFIVFISFMNCNSCSDSQVHPLYLFNIEGNKCVFLDTVLVAVEKRTTQDTLFFVYKSNLDLFGRMDTFRYLIKTDSALYNKSFDLMFDDSLEAKTRSLLEATKSYCVNKKEYRVLKYSLLSMNIYWVEDYGLLLEKDNWRGLYIEYDDVSKTLVDSILRDRTAFSKPPDYPSLLSPPASNKGVNQFSFSSRAESAPG